MRQDDGNLGDRIGRGNGVPPAAKAVRGGPGALSGKLQTFPVRNRRIKDLEHFAVSMKR
jgi:hypothetical protein